MSEEGLTRDEYDHASLREKSFREFQMKVERGLSMAADPRRYVDEINYFVQQNRNSADPIVQGRVNAYIDFLRSIGEDIVAV